MIVVHHLKRDLDTDTRLSATDPLVPNFEAAFADGTYNAKKTAMRLAAVRAILAAGGYVKAAEVDGNDLNYAYRWTNTVDAPWSQQTVKGVRPTGLSPKSSHLGDIFEDTETGIMHVVDSIGFAVL